MVEEAELIMNNLIPYLNYLYGNHIGLYFIDTAKMASKDDSWDNEQGCIIYTTNLFM
jgi:hypothetical protein